MCHMFLVPVFETGSPRTLQPSPVRGGSAGEDGGSGEGNRETHTKRREREGGRDERTAGRE